MKRGTAAKVILGKDTLMDVPAGIVHGTDVILGGKAGLLNDFGGLVLSNNLMIGKKVSRGTITTITVRGQSPLVLPDAMSGSLQAVKAFGGTEQGGVPQGYTQLANITTAGGGYLDTGIIADVDDMEFDIVAKINDSTSISWYILQSRANSIAPIYGISGSASGNTFIGSFSGTNVGAGTTIVRQSGHTYHINSKCQNGTITLTVEDLTDSTSTTNTGTYTFVAGTTNIGLFGNLNGGNIPSGNTSVISAYIKKGGVKVLDYVPALNPSNVVGFYDKATGTFKVSTAGAFVADQTIVPTPTAPIDIVCNNGVLKVNSQGQIYTDGTVETIEDTIGNTATTEMLLKVGDYQDEQEILSGAVTRKVGVKVLDGTEDWTDAGTYGTNSYRFTMDLSVPTTDDATSALCTHIDRIIQSSTTSQSDRPCIRFNITGTIIVWYEQDNTTTLAQFKQWLADQYAAGTPVIVVYPLEEPTTESVTGQTLQVTDGDNTLEVTQASLDNLELEATYKSLVQLTIQEVEDANLNNNVEVTIS